MVPNKIAAGYVRRRTRLSNGVMWLNSFSFSLDADRAPQLKAFGGFSYRKMGTSFVEYKGHGFWSWDGYLEHVLFLLAETIGPSPPESWLNEARDHWREQSTGIFSAWIHPNLDEYVSCEDRRTVVLRLIDELQSRRDVTPEAAETAEFLRRLLLGEITTDAASPLDYMVSGEHPYEWWVRRNAEMEGH